MLLTITSGLSAKMQKSSVLSVIKSDSVFMKFRRVMDNKLRSKANFYHISLNVTINCTLRSVLNIVVVGTAHITFKPVL